jgi:hypothetical protein
MKLYAILICDNGAPTGFHIGPRGPVTFPRKSQADREAARLNALPHDPGRDYRAEPIRD